MSTVYVLQSDNLLLFSLTWSFVAILSYLIICCFSLLGSIHTRHFGTQYCDKKIFFHPTFFSCVYWKYLFLDHYAYWNLVLNCFKMSIQYFEEKNIFFIKMSFYLFISILWAEMSSVYKPLGSIHTRHFCIQYCDKRYFDFSQ